MAVLRASEFIAVQFPTDTGIVVDPDGAALAVTVPGLHSWMSTLDIDVTGDVMIMVNPHGGKNNTLSGFVCDEIRTL